MIVIRPDVVFLFHSIQVAEVYSLGRNQDRSSDRMEATWMEVGEISSIPARRHWLYTAEI